MIRIKTKAEIAVLEQGGRKLAAIMDELGQMIRPGTGTAELERHALAAMRAAGGRPAFKDYRMPDGRLFPTALITCLNHEVVHAPSLPDRTIKDGDIVKIDVGFIFPCPNSGGTVNRHHQSGGYFTDMSRSFIAGRAGGQAQALLDCTRQALAAGISRVKPGATLNDIGTAIQELVESRGFSVVREMVGHGVGHELHEPPQVPHYAITNREFKNSVLKPGMVIAIEPMVNMGGWQVACAPDGLTIVTKDGSLSAHFEHSVAVTEDGNLVLTRSGRQDPPA